MPAWNGTLPTWLVGEDILAADLATMTDVLAALTGAHTAYTPVWSSSGTQPAIGNGTLTGAYTQIGVLIFVRIIWQAGSTTSFGTGTYRFSLPVAPAADQVLGVVFNDASASTRWPGQAWIINASATGDNMRIILAAASENMTESSPVALANGDKLILEGWLLAA